MLFGSDLKCNNLNQLFNHHRTLWPSDKSGHFLRSNLSSSPLQGMLGGFKPSIAFTITRVVIYWQANFSLHSYESNYSLLGQLSSLAWEDIKYLFQKKKKGTYHNINQQVDRLRSLFWEDPPIFIWLASFRLLPVVDNRTYLLLVFAFVWLFSCLKLFHLPSQTIFLPNYIFSITFCL